MQSDIVREGDDLLSVIGIANAVIGCGNMTDFKLRVREGDLCARRRDRAIQGVADDRDLGDARWHGEGDRDATGCTSNLASVGDARTAEVQRSGVNYPSCTTRRYAGVIDIAAQGVGLTGDNSDKVRVREVVADWTRRRRSEDEGITSQVTRAGDDGESTQCPILGAQDDIWIGDQVDVSIRRNLNEFARAREQDGVVLVGMDGIQDVVILVRGEYAVLTVGVSDCDIVRSDKQGGDGLGAEERGNLGGGEAVGDPGIDRNTPGEGAVVTVSYMTRTEQGAEGLDSDRDGRDTLVVAWAVEVEGVWLQDNGVAQGLGQAAVLADYDAVA